MSIFLLAISHVAPSQVRELKLLKIISGNFSSRRTFTGAWIETIRCQSSFAKNHVAPSQVRELKQLFSNGNGTKQGSHLHRCVNWNILKNQLTLAYYCRTFTGAWIETHTLSLFPTSKIVAPSQVRELKLDVCFVDDIAGRSHLHRCVNWNRLIRF